jgi:hypothetical protein
MILSRRILLRIRNVSNKRSIENQNTHFIFSNFSKKNSVYETISKNVEELERPQMTRRQSGACWISKATRAQKHATAVISHPHAHARTYSRAFNRPRKRTHTQICNATRNYTETYYILVCIYIYTWLYICIYTFLVHRRILLILAVKIFCFTFK